MDFLTQSFSARPVERADAADVETISLTSTLEAQQRVSDAFNKLRPSYRHADDGSSQQDSEQAWSMQEPLPLPSVKSAWRTFARVDARFVPLVHGAISRQDSSEKGARLQAGLLGWEYLCERGTIWVQEDAILFILDQPGSVLSAPISLAKGRAFSFDRAFGGRPPPSPRPSLRKLTRSRSGSASSKSLNLSRTRSSEKHAPGPPLERRRSLTKAFAGLFRSRSRKHRDEDVASESEETAQGLLVGDNEDAFIAQTGRRPLTAIRIPTASILAVRRFDAKSSSRLSTSHKSPPSPSLSRTSTRNGTDQPIALSLLENDGGSGASRVELDVGGATGSEGVISFNFIPSLFTTDEYEHFAYLATEARERRGR